MFRGIQAPAQQEVRNYGKDYVAFQMIVEFEFFAYIELIIIKLNLQEKIQVSAK